ncbi:MAG TPA: DUF2092 domain-containing protein [Planktothrix sp.]
MTTRTLKRPGARRPSELILLASAALMLSGGGYALPAIADEMPPTAPAAASNEIDPRADAIVHKLADFYKGLNSMSATLSADSHVEAEGKTKDMQSLYEVKVAKPNKIDFSLVNGPMGGAAKSDGEKLYLYSPQLKMYVEQQATGDLGQLFAAPEFAFISGGFSGLSLLEALVAPDPYGLLMQGVTGAKLVGNEKIDGVDTQHLHFSQKDLVWDIWVDSGSQPWIRRVVPDVSSILSHYNGPAKGMKMELTINYKDLQADPKLAAADFAFTAPADAKKVDSFFKSAQEQEEQHPLTQKPAPALNLDTLAGGKFDLSSFKSKDVVVLDFWATWCPPCRRALPILAEVTKEFKPKGVEFYAVDEMEDPAKIQEYLASQKLDINVALDRKGEGGSAYQVTGIPQTVIVGKDGVVHVVHVGFMPGLKERLTQELDALVQGKEPPPESAGGTD